jgi:hypothetical protein
MLRLASSPQTALAPPSTHSASRRAATRRPSAIIGALLTLILAVALLQHTIAKHSPSPATSGHRPAPHLGLSSLPMAAQGVVSATLGADDPVFRITASGGGFQAQSPAQRLRMRFGSTGVQIGSGKAQVNLSLRAVGYGTVLRPVESAQPSASANGVTYAHSGLSEWYRNGPLGLEQGFTIPRAPSGHPAGVLTLSMAVSGNMHASLESGGQSITFTHPGGPSLRYRGLAAIDASGRALHSWLVLYRGRIMLRVDTRGGRYPLRIDPFIQQGAKLIGSGAVGAPQAGTVAISGDGNTAIVGGWGDDEGAGAVWIFTRSGSTWTQQGEKITRGVRGGNGHYPSTFGDSVALSYDGNTALVGGSEDDELVGSAWVFTRSGTTWSQQGEVLRGSESSLESRFGWSVALSADGNTALIGGIGDSEGAGAAWVFVRSGSTWSQQGPKLTGTEEVGRSGLGSSVALSENGNTALVGGAGDNKQLGAVWVFVRSGTTWTQQGPKLTENNPIHCCSVGVSVALSADGNTALIGTGMGAVWVLTRSGTTWSEPGQELRSHQLLPTFGESVALSADGTAALIGEPASSNYSGAAWVYRSSHGVWDQQPPEELTGTEEIGEAEFGWTVALSADGHTAFVGGDSDNSDVGAAWAFGEPAPTVVTEPASSLTHTSATLNATVNPNGSAVTECKFEYGTSTSYGSSVPCLALPGEGSSPTAVSASVESLNESTTYHFRIVATNSGGTSHGADDKLTTLGPPDFGRCVKVAAEKEGKKTVYHGKFTAATCLVESPTKSGKYEWSPGIAKAHFSSTLKEGRVTLETVTKVKMTCNTESGTGEYSGTKEVANIIVRFTGCETSGHKCTTPGLAEGELQTKTLEGELGWEAKAGKSVALDLYPVGKTGAFMEYHCIGGVPVTVAGSILAPVEADKMLLTTPLKYKASKGKQKPEQFEGGPLDVLTANGKVSEQLGETASLTQTNEEAVEINAAV